MYLLKYRVYLYGQRRMVYDAEQRADLPTLIALHNGSTPPEEVGPVLLMRSTTVESVAGALIYEGDLVYRQRASERLGLIRWSTKCAGWTVTYPDHEEALRSVGLKPGRYDVAGNIVEDYALWVKAGRIARRKTLIDRPAIGSSAASKGGNGYTLEELYFDKGFVCALGA